MIDDELVRTEFAEVQSPVGLFLYPRRFMTDNVELNVGSLSRTLRKQASGFRQLAGESLDGEFRSRLLDLAGDYDRQADSLDHRDAAGW